jgi:hypothetical protein
MTFLVRILLLRVNWRFRYKLEMVLTAAASRREGCEAASPHRGTRLRRYIFRNFDKTVQTLGSVRKSAAVLFVRYIAGFDADAGEDW